MPDNHIKTLMGRFFGADTSSGISAMAGGFWAVGLAGKGLIWRLAPRFWIRMAMDRR